MQFIGPVAACSETSSKVKLSVITCILVSRVGLADNLTLMIVKEQEYCFVSMLGKRRRQWVTIETA